jgi:hypothetical protein
MILRTTEYVKIRRVTLRHSLIFRVFLMDGLRKTTESSNITGIEWHRNVETEAKNDCIVLQAILHFEECRLVGCYAVWLL